ncbi:MAG: LacI family DNA-binding transcriptional regulator [Candidatus Lokiarchaeota archaeon]|nr:LacI family DNA-binding transcriptional regulator [Candidatus Lokiarchaeota archaeon]
MIPTIGFFIDWISSANHIELILSLEEAAKKAGVNLLTIMGGALNSPKIYEAKSNKLYNNPKDIPIDGLIIESGLLGLYCNYLQMKEFISRFNHIPVVSLSKKIESIHTIIIDASKGFNELISHVIKKHKCQNFAYISGPKENDDSNKRLEVFKSTLKENQITWNEKAIYYGKFINTSGNEAINYFFDDLNISPDVIVAANDDMAMGAINELKKRKILIPDTIKIIGFDDQINAKFFNPPLSTVKIPTNQICEKAIEVIKDLIDGKKKDELIEIPTKMIIRSSCGCDNSRTNESNSDNFNLLPKKQKIIINFIDAYRNIGYTRDIGLLEKVIPYLFDNTNILLCIISFFQNNSSENLSPVLKYMNNEAKISKFKEIFKNPYHLLKSLLRSENPINIRLFSIIFQDKVIGTIIYQVKLDGNLLGSAMRTNLLDNLAKTLYIHQFLNHY